MTLSHDLSSSRFYIPRRVSGDLCLHVATLAVQACSAPTSAIRIVDRIHSHDSNCAVSGILSLVFILKTPFNTSRLVTAQFNEFYRKLPSRRSTRTDPSAARGFSEWPTNQDLITRVWFRLPFFEAALIGSRLSACRRRSTTPTEYKTPNRLNSDNSHPLLGPRCR
jgi:hypothetical protein